MLGAILSPADEVIQRNEEPSAGKPSPSGDARAVVLLHPGPPLRVQVFRRTRRGLEAVGPVFTSRRRGKMASAADVDGDGRLDLLLLVWKKTRYDPQPGWRPFVYTLREGRWAPKWLGSRVGRPLEEAAFVRTPSGVRMLTIERSGENQTVLTLYHWRGFGFWGEWTGEPTPSLSGLRVSDRDADGIDELSAAEPGGKRLWFEFRENGYTEIKTTGGNKR
jgi:hypothetical protein